MSVIKQNPSARSPIIRVVLADDHHVVRSGIRSELERHADMEVVGEAADGYEALSLVARVRPNVLLLDINMPGLPGTAVTEQLNEMPDMQKGASDSFWPPHILILSAYCEPEYVYNLFAAGAKGYLLKDEAPERIVAGIRQVMRGEPALSLPVQRVLLTRKSKPDHDLSTRELEVLRLIAKGNTNEEIADILVIAIGTVKNHVMNIYKKLPNVRTRSEAVAWAWENRIVEIE
ncbi:MAG: response regulator transcription factor [Anaerolineae bacterium]|nr:response regulator transcription factor [Anaerolineae bacterium]